jgi:hypothetical protein
MLGTPRRTWEDNIKMGLTINWKEGDGWISLTQDRDMWQALEIDVYL